MNAKQRAQFEEQVTRLLQTLETGHDDAVRAGNYSRATEYAQILREAAAGLPWAKVRPEFTTSMYRPN